MSKTKPKYLQALQERQQAMMLHVADIVDLKKKNHPQLRDGIKNKPVEYWMGLADGVNALFEDALHKAKCYKGFSYVYFEHGEMHRVATEDVQQNKGRYQEWCREYH